MAIQGYRELFTNMPEIYGGESIAGSLDRDHSRVYKILEHSSVTRSSYLEVEVRRHPAGIPLEEPERLFRADKRLSRKVLYRRSL